MTFSMRRSIYAMLLLASSVAAGKYVFVEKWQTWPDAQLYCRKNFAELASFSISQDMDEINKALEGIRVRWFWVGLYRGETVDASWRWSGGGNASNLPWASEQPVSSRHQAELCMRCNNKSYGLYTMQTARRFLCLNLVVVVMERRTWEGALEYCRERHDDLASLTSETDQLLVASREIREALIDERVWVGLRHFGARWMWLQGEPLGNNASLRMGLQHCSTCHTQQCYTCGSLSPSGELQGLDCKTELHFLCF